MPSNNDIFQSSFLNGLSMATAQESGKLAAMQQATQLRYGLQSKQLDFQLSLLKMRESQAAQAVELRMAQGQHDLEMRKNALMVEKFEMEKKVLETKMEEDKVATAAGSLFEQYQAGMRNKGFLPNSPEEIAATDAALAAGGTFSNDPRVHARIASSHTARKDALQKDAFSQGTLALKAVERTRQESRVDAAGREVTERFYGESSLADLHMAAEAFKRGADLGHEPSRQMYNRIQQDITSVGKASKPGVTPAAGEAEQMRTGFIEPKAPGQMEKLRYPGAPDRAIEEARKDWRSDDVALAGQYIEGARARLLELQKQARVSRSEEDVAAIAQASAALSELEAAAKDETGLPGWLVNSRVGQAMSLGGGAVYREEKPYGWDAPGTEFRVVSPTLRQLENLQLAKSPQALLNEIDAIHRQVRSKRPRGTFNDGPFVRY